MTLHQQKYIPGYNCSILCMCMQKLEIGWAGMHTCGIKLHWYHFLLIATPYTNIITPYFWPVPIPMPIRTMNACRCWIMKFGMVFL